jgi:UDP-N-acetylmuramoylalanine--D-glutamate ligase
MHLLPDWADGPDRLSGRRVVVMGLGLQAGGLGVARFLRDNGARVVVTDLRSAEELEPSIEALGVEGIRYVLGRHDAEDFRGADLVVRNPSVRDGSPYLTEALKAGIPVETEMTLFLRWCTHATIVGVTGTRGKTTTATALQSMFNCGGMPSKLAGNMQVSALAQLEQIAEGSMVVLELSSAQLEALNEKPIRVDGAVITNLMPDHLDRYQDMQMYAKAKLPLVANQRCGDWAVIPRGGGWPEWFADRAGGEVLRPDLEVLPSGWCSAKVAGRHNRDNLVLAAAAARRAGIAEAAIQHVVEQFAGVPARQEFLGWVNGVRMYNDTTATTPEATLAALNAISGPLVVIAGGSDKRVDFAPLANRLCNDQDVRAVILLPGAGTDRLLPLLTACRVELAGDMASAVTRALMMADPGDAVLLSPACASFGLFKNEFDRGDQFEARLAELGLER